MADSPAYERFHAAQARGRVSVPRHLAVIPDGNRRWADVQGVRRHEGHRRGFEVARHLARFCRRVGIHTVSIWAFSTDNWKRDPREVRLLMQLYERWVKRVAKEAVRDEVRLVHIGRMDGIGRQPDWSDDEWEQARRNGCEEGLPAPLRELLREVSERTAGFDRNVLNIALNYGGPDEVQRAAERMSRFAAERHVDVAKLDVYDFLDTSGQPHSLADVIVRTSGEVRLSGFFPLQSVYAELVFIRKHFPELTEDDLVDVVLEFSRRERRRGGNAPEAGGVS